MRYRQQMINDDFFKLGFNSTEVIVYLALAEIGKSTAALLAKKVNIPRTTVYSSLDNLQIKGLVSVEKKKKVTFYTANNPQAILRNIEKEKKEVISRENFAKNLVQEILPYFKSKNFSIPKIQFFEGQKNVESMLYQHTERWHESMAKYDSIYWGYQDHTFVENYMDWLEWSWKIRPDNIQIKLISNKARIEKSLKGKVSGRHILQVDKNLDFSSSIWICGDYIVLIMTRQEPHYSFQLMDPVFATNLRSLFQLLWQFLA